ncbi:MAG: TRC40/GET3/ArsA family transport-energizing ATPase, partial [Planctomycetota bacterium]
MELLAKASRLLFFTGKGGVGKTSLACATAVRLADDGKRVLLVSTDPASNLDQVFGLTIGDHEPTAIPEVPRLHVLNVDPGAAAAAYRDRLIGPVRNLLPPEAIRSMEEQLSGACTTEIAAFDEFTGLLTDPEVALNYDHLIFDTAPTGHTLRLLQLPSAWSGFLESSPNGTSCLGPLAGLEKQRHRYTEAVALLGNPASTQMVLVSRAQKAALREAARTSHELQAMGVCNQILILNGLLPQPTSGDPL